MTDQERIQFLSNELERVSCELKETKRRLWDEKDKVEKLQQSCADLGAEIGRLNVQLGFIRDSYVGTGCDDNRLYAALNRVFGL